MAADPKHKWTVEEYLAFERASEERHEYVDGEIIDMVGASERHNWIATNMSGNLYPQVVAHGCRIYSNDMQVRGKSARHYLYPDIVVVCGERQIEHGQQDTLLNPTLVIEILSPSTERRDRGQKFLAYKAIPSLQTYVLVSQDAPRVEQYTRREGDIWEYKETSGLDAEVEFVSIQCKLQLAHVYQGVSFEHG